MNPLWLPAVLTLLLMGCSTPARVVRLGIKGETPVVFNPHGGAAPVEVRRDTFQEAMGRRVRELPFFVSPQRAARRLFDVDARSGSFVYDARTHLLRAVEPGEALEQESPPLQEELTHAYLRWCEHTGRSGDCLRLLEENPTLTGEGRYVLAMALAKGAVLDEMLEAFKDMADPHAVVSTVLWTCTTYMLLLSLPEPISKGIAAVMTASLIAYVGVDTFWGLWMGFKRLVLEADRATTFKQLREAGERYGRIMGRDAARAFAMLATVAIGNTASGMAAKVSQMPGAMQAATMAEAQVGLRLVAVGEVESVSVSAGSIEVVVAPGAVAMAANGQGPRRFSKQDRDEAYEKSRDTKGQARCEYCDKELSRESGQSKSYESDHRIPYSKGGPSSAENLAPACRTCNREKGSKELETDWVPPKDR